MPGKKRAGGAAATRDAIKEREEEYMDAGAADEPTADKRPRHSNEVPPLHSPTHTHSHTPHLDPCVPSVYLLIPS
jgi:hypothetical protein